jgi:hypothetical protein
VGGANIQIVHYFDHAYLEEEKSILPSFTITFEAKYLTSMVTSVPPYETFSLIKNNILHQSKNYKNHFENSILRYVTFSSCWSCDIQFHKYAVHTANSPLRDNSREKTKMVLYCKWNFNFIICGTQGWIMTFWDPKLMKL